MKSLLVVLLMLMALIGWAGAQESTGTRRNVGGVTMTFVVEPARIEIGETVRLTARLVNNTGTAETLVFSSGRQYDFWLTDDGQEVWRWSTDMAFTQEVAQRTLEGQSGITFAESWTADRAGAFVAHATVLAEGYERELTGIVDVS